MTDNLDFGHNDMDDGYVVGLGASAGGLEAIHEFFENMPGNTNFSFVVIQHLSPDYKSLMAELLSRHTVMQVYEAQHETIPRPNCIYLIPPRKILTLKNGRLHLEEKIRDQHPNFAIDIFFKSLAEDKKGKAVAIVLSGTGTDGARGVEAIKNNGGIVLVQDPITAEFDGMPNSAISTGYADLILSPEMMPDELIDLLRDGPLLKPLATLNRQDETIFLEILQLILKFTNYDFSRYKRPTLNRRLAKRMAEKNYNSLTDYYEYLNNHTDEVTALCQEFLINVTAFFRDEDAFELIRTQVIPALFLNRVPGDVIKIWIVACSTGEEAYTLAILLEEYLQQHKLFDISIKMFATDIDQQALETASKGLYTQEALKPLSPERIQQFFIKEEDRYRVIPSLRKTVVFAKHDITRDPPFSKIDLLSCRNMLIYMTPLLQKNILQKFHFALNEDGYLFLGPSENIGILKDVVKEADKKWKIYRCISKTKTGEYETNLNPIGKSSYIPLPANPPSKSALNNLSEIFKDTLLEEYNYAGIFIDKDFEVKQAIGNFKDFMRFPEGNFNFNLLKLVPTDLSIALSTCIRKAIKNNEKVVLKRVKVVDDAGEKKINIIVKPYLQTKTYLQPFLFVVLHEVETEPGAKKQESGRQGEDTSLKRLDELEDELRDTKENLQAVIEEVQSANEELQSSNEEILSANEELQSTNEELQSLNEELHTVNAEHQLKIKELIEVNDDMNNYFINTEMGQILIDEKLIIRKFTPVVTRQVNLIASDLGRSVADISTNFNSLDFINDLKGVIHSGKPVEKEIVMNDNEIFLMRIVSFIRQDKTTDGVVVNFIDITEVRKLNSLLQAVFNSSASGITAKRAIRNERNEIIDFEYIAANTSAQDIMNFQSNSIVGKKMLQEFPSMEQKYFSIYAQVMDTGKTMQFEFYNETTGRWFEIVCVRMMMDSLVTTFTEITGKKKAADQLAKGYEDLQIASGKLESINHQLEKSNFELLQFASVASHDLKEPLRKFQAFGNLLKEKAKDKLETTEYNYLEKVINSSNRMQRLVDDILTLSKLSNSEIPYTKTNLNGIIAQITEDLEITIKERQAEITTGELPTIQAVSQQMHQLFQNLMSNALKFNESDHPLISVFQQPVRPAFSEEHEIDPEKFVCIVVKDNGIGFDEQYKEKIFGIFQRLDGALYKGTGIGLAICKKIVEHHNGFVEAESKLGTGSSFLVYLPK